MAYYYKYRFVSPEGIYAIVKEELKSYFDTGAIDDLLFPTYLNRCLDKLGKSSYSIAQEIVQLRDFTASLPDNFQGIREVWLCAEVDAAPYQAPNAFYSQAITATTIQVGPVVTNLPSCPNADCLTPGCDGSCMPEMIQTVYKTTGEVAHSYRRMFLLTPGNVSARSMCDNQYAPGWRFTQSSAQNSFDIRDGKLYTNFRSGTLYLVFYATENDTCGNQMVPDNGAIKDYIEQYIKYKMFEQLTNQVNDETFNQLEKKMMYYQKLSDEAYILADIEIKKQDIHTKLRAIRRDSQRLQKYELPSPANRYGRRR